MKNNLTGLLSGLAIAVGAWILASIIINCAELFVFMHQELIMLIFINIPLLVYACVITPGQKNYPILLYAVLVSLSMDTCGYTAAFLTALPALIFLLVLKAKKPLLESVIVCAVSVAAVICVVYVTAHILLDGDVYNALMEHLHEYLTTNSLAGALRAAALDPSTVTLEQMAAAASSPLSVSEADSLINGLADTLSLWFPYSAIIWSLGIGFWGYFFTAKLSAKRGIATGHIPSFAALRLPKGARTGVFLAIVCCIIFGLMDYERYSPLIFSTISVFSYILAVQGLSLIFCLSDLRPKPGGGLKSFAIIMYLMFPVILSGAGLFDVTVNLRRLNKKEKL